ncbi:MAG: hypothetical protein AAGD01_08830 [Acidobacteriota bacterium]
MSVQELTLLHNRYVDLSDRFRAAWAFHQFLQSVRKMFLPAQNQRPSADFQEVYSRLKAVSQNLNASEADSIRVELTGLASRIERLTAQILEEDSKVAPQYVRRFFQKVKGYDDKLLTQLVKLYLFGVEHGEWNSDRIDKADFLLTRLAEEKTEEEGRLTLRDGRRLAEILEGLWRVLNAEDDGGPLVEGHLSSLKELRALVEPVASLDELNDQNLVGRYRDIKHSLGELFFEPRLLRAILETNITLHNKVQRLYREEERRVIIDYQRIFELEREVPVDSELTERLDRFRKAVERFETSLQGREISLNDLASLKDHIRDLLPQLNAASRSGGDLTTSSGEHKLAVGTPSAGSSGGFGIGDDEAQLELRESYERLEAALSEASPLAPPQTVALSRELFPYRLEPREILAYRRLNTDPQCNRSLERFLLEAAALRVRINEQADEIKGLLDDTAVTGDGPLFTSARRTVRLADSFQRQFDHLIDRAVLLGHLDQANPLQILRMRLVRDSSGLWLLVYKRFLSSRHMAT